MTSLKVLISESLNPHLNLATEEWIFHNMDPSSQVLFLWRNDNTVVIGRNQNPWSECNLEKMKADDVHLARRVSGGGAVFQDLGNTNFTLLSPKAAYKRENNIQIILQALAGFGIQGEASGRNDLLIPYTDGPRKFSGSAYREKQDRAFHHGTLLLSADLTRLGQYLTPNIKKLQAKGKESVRARVANLTEKVPGLDHHQICESLIASFEKFYGARASKEILTLDSLSNNPQLNDQYTLLSSWDWLYGRTLEFTQKMDQYFSLGFFDFHFKVDEGTITDLHIYSDCLFPTLVDSLTEGLKGQLYNGDSVRKVFNEIRQTPTEWNENLAEIEEWLIRQIEI